MEINFDEKEGKPFSQSEINKLKRDLNAEKFQNIYNIHNNSMTLESKNYNLEEEKNSDNNVIQEQNNDNNNNNYINKIIHSEEINKKHCLNEINLEKDNNIKNSESTPKSSKKEEEFQEEEIPPELNNNNNNKDQNKTSQEKFFDLIPLWYTCLNKDHGTNYISLDRKKESLICKYCFQSGALETNLDLNHEFVDKYIKDLEEKNRMNNSELSKDIIKETSEENISEREETSHKLNVEENSSNISSTVKDQINCLTFLCQNFPYYLCETCKDFICYKCISKNMDNNNEKSRHYFHDIESVNYEANSFRDDVNINLDTLETILNSLDFLINEEKKRIKNFRYKINEESRIEISDYYVKAFERIKANVIEKNKELYGNYCKKNFQNKDNDVNDLYISNNNIKSNVNDVLEELKKIKEKLNDKNISNEDKCELHNKYIELIKEANILITKGKSILSQSNKILNDLNSEETINKFSKSESIQNKLLSEKEKNFIQSLSNTNKNKGSYKLNRFVTYRYEGLKYLGFSTLEFSCNNDIVLYGIFLCGKFLSSNKIKQKDYSEIPIDQRGFYDINVKLYELKNKSVLFNENKKLYEIIEANNPIIQISFDKGITINKDKKYVIVVENLESDKFCELWVGNVHKKLIVNKTQNVKCNNTGLEFNFCLSNEFNSDFNEFKQGIIEGILYGD